MQRSADGSHSQTVSSNTSHYTSTWGSLSRPDQNFNHIKYPPNRSLMSEPNSKQGMTSDLANSTPCKCACKPQHFQNTKCQLQEVRKETCKLVNSVAELYKTTPTKPTLIDHNMNAAASCNCVCDNKSSRNTIKETRIGNYDDDGSDDLCSLLIGLSQFHPAANLVNLDPFNSVPKIAIVPPTPDTNLTKSGPMLWDNLKPGHNDTRDQSIDFSPDDSPQDEEPPYHSLNSSLKRFGTVSSLDRIPSDETDDQTCNSSGAEDNDDADIKVVTKEVFDSAEPTTRNWSNRAGSFLEQSRAFLDSYLGRWDRSNDDDDRDMFAAENADECASGATSGEEIWGTPTSGENDEMQAFHSDQGHSVNYEIILQ